MVVKKSLVTLSLICLVVLVVGVYYLHNGEEKVSYAEPNYYGLVKLGLAPNSEPRLANPKDIDTGLRTEYVGQRFGLFNSRTWEEGDYGKTFISPVDN